MRRKLRPQTIPRARELRKRATPFERALWDRLRELNRFGYHFRRQVPFRSYILDFAEHGARLVIELDGSQHGLAENLRQDSMRDALLKSEGYIVLRFWNGDVIERIDGVIEDILRAAPPPPTRSASRSDLPTRGR